MNMVNGHSDPFNAVRAIIKTIDGVKQSREFMTMTNSDVQSRMTTATKSGTTVCLNSSTHEND